MTPASIQRSRLPKASEDSAADPPCKNAGGRAFDFAAHFSINGPGFGFSRVG